MPARDDPIMTRQVIADIDDAIKRSLASRGVPAILSLPSDQVPLEQLVFVLGWKCRVVPADELGGEPGRGERGLVGWPTGVEDSTPTWALIVQGIRNSVYGQLNL